MGNFDDRGSKGSALWYMAHIEDGFPRALARCFLVLLAFSPPRPHPASCTEKKGGRLSSGHLQHGNLVPAGGWESWSIVARLLGAWGVCAAVVVSGRPACEIVAVKGVGVLHACPGRFTGGNRGPAFSPALLSCCVNQLPRGRDGQEKDEKVKEAKRNQPKTPGGTLARPKSQDMERKEVERNLIRLSVMWVETLEREDRSAGGLTSCDLLLPNMSRWLYNHDPAEWEYTTWMPLGRRYASCTHPSRPCCRDTVMQGRKAVDVKRTHLDLAKACRGRMQCSREASYDTPAFESVSQTDNFVCGLPRIGSLRHTRADATIRLVSQLVSSQASGNDTRLEGAQARKSSSCPKRRPDKVRVP
ncbi:hypothetical protein CGRA01v4_06796 [Colletotrichum graminicola]|nr:hypothetical protein CGRA01v4_06796 [Colletotrichum graminicola]